MNKVRSTVKHMPRKAKLLTALLACVLVLTLVGVGMAETVPPEYILPFQTEADGGRPIEPHKVPVANGALELSRPTGENMKFNGYQDEEEKWWGESWAWNKSTAEVIGNVQGLAHDNDDGYDGNKGFLRITNASGTSKTVSFGYRFEKVEDTHNKTDASLQIGEGADSLKEAPKGTYKVILQPKGYFDICISVKAVNRWTGQDNYPEATLTLSNIKAEEVTTGQESLILQAPDTGGSYTYKTSNGTETPVTADISVNYSITNNETVTLKATAASGYKFYLWEDSNGKILSTNAEFVVSGTNGANPKSVKPVFVSDGTVAYYHIPDGTLKGDYYYWQDAMSAARTNSNTNVVLLDTLTLNSSMAYSRKEEITNNTLTIPSGVTLVVPYSEKNSTDPKDAVNVDQTGGNAFDCNSDAIGKVYRKLDVPNGTTLRVEGDLLVHALQGSKNGVSFESHIVGNYGQMTVSGTVDVLGTLYALGDVSGVGRINVKNNGTLYQMMQITDWRGGNYAAPVAINTQFPVLPISQYYLQNNKVHTIYESGSTMRAYAAIAASYQSPVGKESPVTVISNGSSEDDNKTVFVMDENASVETTYNADKDQLNVTLSGDTSMNCLSLSTGSYGLDTSGKELAVSDNMQITVKGGTMTVKGGLKFLPGAKLTVESNATVNVAQNGKMFFYAKDDYKGEYTYPLKTEEGSSKKLNGRTHVDGTYTLPADDATLDLQGSLVINGILALSKNHTGLVANPNAMITVNKTYESGDLKLYEPYMELKSTAGVLPDAPVLGDDDVGACLAASDKTKGEADYVFENRGWTAPKGITVDGGDSAVAFDQGTYQVLGGKWYSHKITVNYTGISGSATKEVYTAKPECTFTAPEGYVITGIDTGKTGITAANADTADSTPISDGWKSVKLSNITAQEATLTATVKSYEHDVTWVRTTTEGAETKTTTTHSYLPSGTSEATLTFDGKVNIDANNVKIDGKAADSRFTSAVENDKTVVKVTGITQNTKIEVPYSSSNTVTWVVTTDKGDAVTTKAQTVAGSATYSLGNTESENWKVVELDGGVSIKQPSGSKAKLKARTDKTADITVTDVLQDITVNITVTTYKHKVTTNTTVYDADQKNTDKIETIEDFTNDATYTPTLTKIGPNEKYVVSKYEINGGTLGSKPKADVCAILPKDVSIALSGKDVVVSLELQSYLYVWNWDATLDNGDKDTPLGFTYTEYLTDRLTGGEPARPNDYTETPYYLTLRDYGEAGKYYHHYDNFAYEGYFGIDYRSLGNNRFTISRTQKLPDYTGEMGSASLADGVLTESSWTGKIALKDEQVTVALVSYTTKVTVKGEAGSRLPVGVFYADADGKDVTTADDAADRKDIVYGQFAYGEEGYDAHRFVKSYTIGSENAPGTTVNDVGALLGNRFTSDSVKKFHGMTIPADTVKTAASSANGELTVSLTTEEFWQVYAVSEDNGGNYTYLMFVPEVSKDGTVPIYAPKAEKFNVSCTRQTDEGGTIHYSPTLKVKEGENWFFQECVYGTTIDVGGKTLNIVGDNDGPNTNTCAKMVQFTLTPYTASLTWNVDNASGTTYVTEDGKGYCDLKSDKTQMLEDTRYSNDTWTYTVPTGQTVAPNGLNYNYCDAVYEGGKVTVSGLTAKSTVSITTSAETSTDVDTYYMGDMSFEYVRNAAAFTWDGKAEGGGSWKPVNAFGWRHAVGSKSYEVGDETLTVDNGSILFVNTMKNTPVTYTVQLSKNGTTDYGVSLMFDESDKAINVNEDGVATVTVPANSRVTLVCRMTGTPKFNGEKEINIGTITVTKK